MQLNYFGAMCFLFRIFISFSYQFFSRCCDDILMAFYLANSKDCELSIVRVCSLSKRIVFEIIAHAP